MEVTALMDAATQRRNLIAFYSGTEVAVGTNTAEYGEHDFRTRTNDGREVYFTLNFQPEKPAEQQLRNSPKLPASPLT